ncbi:hypothetical protein MHEL_40470 [Mycolicibacterium helvum]|uniref:Uncharacterized protein n=1 Tax=Mycolicibacterium helvum TaxID=1534349 RepID=A0A7I7T968_9MYCO|nr:hypothetical protein MHEL_40470 [Mycolicibacterium helvum]
MALVAVFGGGSAVAPPAGADPAPALTQALSAARGGGACGSLSYNPTVEHAADIVNRSTVTYLEHTADNIPADQAHPTDIVKDLGITTDKVVSLQGAGHDVGDAIKGLLLQGREVVLDCSYTDFGVSQLYDPGSDYTLVVAVLVGKPT